MSSLVGGGGLRLETAGKSTTIRTDVCGLQIYETAGIGTIRKHLHNGSLLRLS